MKKTVSVLMMFIAGLTMTFTSCSSSSTSEVPTATFTSLSVKYSLNTTGDFLKLFDVTVQYKDASGITQTETVTTNDYSKTVTVSSLPYTSGVKFTIKMKDGVDQTKTYSYSRSFTTAYNPTYSDGSVSILKNSSVSETLSGVRYERLNAEITSMNKVYNEAYTFSLSDSKIVQTSTSVNL
jgi:hypothetical protein